MRKGGPAGLPFFMVALDAKHGWPPAVLQHPFGETGAETMETLLREFTPEFLAANRYKIPAAKTLECTDALLLDVRSADEEECMSIAADLENYPEIAYRHIPMNELPDRLDELPEDREILVFCRTTNRSPMVYAFLRTRGFDRVRLVEGGYVALVKLLVEAHGI